MSDRVIPKEYEARVKEIGAYLGNPIKTVRQINLVEELKLYHRIADLQAKLEKREQKCKWYSEQQTEDHDLIQLLRTENAALKRPVTDEEAATDDNYVAWLKFTHGTLKIADSTDEGAYKVWRKSGINKLFASRSQEAQKGATE